jgi:hypothetical protein|tara:strand:- start:56 stop:517 length:462 start_codon:yes stop_codon:yes gene_type:complete
MAITNAICNVFKTDILKGVHNFSLSGGNTYKLALFTSSATLNKSTTAYSAPSDGTANPTNTHEVTSTGTSYSTGGGTLTNITPVLSGDVAQMDFQDETFSTVTLTANGALIYKNSSNEAVMAVAFGGDKTATSGDFTVQFPNPSSATAIIEIN